MLSAFVLSIQKSLQLNTNRDDRRYPEFSSVQSALKRKRLSLKPETPQTIDDVDIVGEWTTTSAGRPFLSHIDNEWGVCVFSTDKNYHRLLRCDTVFIDGTFNSCPPSYEQFVTIHGLYHGMVIPFVMALATGKRVGYYLQILQHVKVRIRYLMGHRFSPRMAICDFEQSLRIAFDTELPRTRFRNCYLHFCQSLWRRLQELGLAVHIQVFSLASRRLWQLRIYQSLLYVRTSDYCITIGERKGFYRVSGTA
jgi:hypothetical protein